MAQIVIISGPPGAGKSSVCESLCERYDRTVHLETDWFYEAIRMGHAKPWLAGSERQNRMVARAAARAVSAYTDELFAVFIDGVIGPDLLPVYAEELKPLGVPVHFVLLMPSFEVARLRAWERTGAAHIREPQLRAKREGGQESEFLEFLPRLYDWLANAGDFGGCRVDNTTMTAEQTADAVMDACGRGECLISDAGRA